jgi:hypothetical protein
MFKQRYFIMIESENAILFSLKFHAGEDYKLLDMNIEFTLF